MKNSAFSKRNVFPLLFWIALTVLSIVATFIFSSQDAQVSGGLSMRIVKRLLSLFPFLISFVSVGTLHKIVRKLAHFTLYFVLGCGLRGLTSYQRRVPAIPAVVVGGAAYAALDEFHQRFAQGRAPSAIDVAIDTCGVIAGCAFVSLLFLLARRGRYAVRKAFWLSLTVLVALAIILCSSLSAARVGTLSLQLPRRLLSLFPFLSAWNGAGARLHTGALVRLALYFCLGFGLRGFYAYQRRFPAAPAAIAVGTLCAALDEFFQRLAPGRSPSLTDALMDVCGVVAGCVVASLLFFLFRGKRVRAS